MEASRLLRSFRRRRRSVLCLNARAVVPVLTSPLVMVAGIRERAYKFLVTINGLTQPEEGLASLSLLSNACSPVLRYGPLMA
jgi:hypothetical protein